MQSIIFLHLFFFFPQLLQLQSKGHWLGQQRKIFMLKPQELKPKSSAVTCCQETCRCFSFCSQNTSPLLFLTFDVDDDDANYITMVTFDSVSAFLRRSFFLTVGVCLALTSEALHGICNPLWIWIWILFRTVELSVTHRSLCACCMGWEWGGQRREGANSQ